MEQDYLPFGGDLPKVGQVEVYNQIGMEYKYTGQNEVVSIGLYYYGARYYDPAIGRFITEDTYQGEMNNPQSQHLYVYVMNNSLRYIDPTGHMATPVLHDGGGGGSWDEDDGVGGGSTQSPERSKPRGNNTNIEGPNIYIHNIDYAGPYNANIKEKLEKICIPDVVEYVDMASKTLDKEEFNDFVNYIFDIGGIVTPPDVEFGKPQITAEGLMTDLNKLLGSKEIQVILKKLPKDQQISVIGLGFGGSGGFVGGGQADFLVVFDDKGNIAAYHSFAAGYFIGKGLNVGARLLTSRTADNVNELRGSGFTASFEFGAKGKTGSYSIGIGTSGEMSHTFGYNFWGRKPIFLGVDGSTSAMISYSFVYGNKNIGETDFYKNTIKPIFDIIQMEELKIGIK